MIVSKFGVFYNHAKLIFFRQCLRSKTNFNKGVSATDPKFQQSKPKTQDNDYESILHKIVEDRDVNIKKQPATRKNKLPPPGKSSINRNAQTAKSLSLQSSEKQLTNSDGVDVPCETKQTPLVKKEHCFQKEKKPCPPTGGSVCDNNDKSGLKMSALVADYHCRQISLEEVPVPNLLKKDEVMIQVAYAGANLIDMVLMETGAKSNKEKMIPGREFSGVVCGVGDDVGHVKAGDAVAVAPCLPDTLCKFCAQEKSFTCIKEGAGRAVGVTRNGGWAEFCAVPGNTVYKVTDLHLKKAVLLPQLAQIMCSISRIDLSQDMDIVIQGCGLFGSVCALLLQRNGYDKVSICEDNAVRLKLIEGLQTGFPIISPVQLCGMKVDAVLTNGAGADVMQKALHALKPHGQFIVIGQPGGNGDTPQIRINTSDISKRQIHIRGLVGTPSNPSGISPSAAEEIIDFCKLGILVYPMSDFKEGFTKIGTSDANFVVLEIQSNLQ